MKEYYVYILANKPNGTLYVGVTSDLIKRIWQHKACIVEGFTSKYKVNMLVYYEMFIDIKEAIKREKNIKAWKREWKLRIIEQFNPNWNDLYKDITGSQPSLG
jgi:putative endonuclease